MFSFLGSDVDSEPSTSSPSAVPTQEQHVCETCGIRFKSEEALVKHDAIHDWLSNCEDNLDVDMSGVIQSDDFTSTNVNEETDRSYVKQEGQIDDVIQSVSEQGEMINIPEESYTNDTSSPTDPDTQSSLDASEDSDCSTTDEGLEIIHRQFISSFTYAENFLTIRLNVHNNVILYIFKLYPINIILYYLDQVVSKVR